MPASTLHLPVLFHEIILALQPRREGYYVDGTLGAGGHAAGILEVSQPDGHLLGMDLDPQAITLAHERLSLFSNRVVIVQASYTNLREQLNRLGWQAVNGILLDLGVSSMQLDTTERGFSFQSDAPLDMRFDPANGVTADDLVNSLSEKELADVLFRYGEERRAYQVARAIVRARPVHSTLQLASIVARATSGGRPGFHPATRTFQALRIAVNRELEALESVLPQAVDALAPAGRLAVISFHSLEDRIVKQYFRQESRDCICPPRQPVCTCGHHARLREINRRPIQPGEAEISANPRARSAKLRVVEKI
jgi:16S rRNA (cytosine1402-N4)-methyltransferase